MDLLKKKLAREIEEMQHHSSRMMRNMSLARMLPFESGTCQPHVDVYESEGEFYIYFDVAGAESKSLSVIADDKQVRVSGRRELPGNTPIACVHQLEIEMGSFDRLIPLPARVDVDMVTSTYKNGVLVITLPKKKMSGKVNVTITSDE